MVRLDANFGIALGQKKPVAKRENGANVYMLRSALLYDGAVDRFPL